MGKEWAASTFFKPFFCSFSAVRTVCHLPQIHVFCCLLYFSQFCFPCCEPNLSLSSASVNVSLYGGTPPPPYLPSTSSPATLSFSGLSLSISVCVYLSHSPPPLFAIFFFHFSFFYLGAHSSPPTLEILTK